MSGIKTIVTTPGAGISRREFTLETCLAILAGAAITIVGSGCGGGGGSPAGPSGGPGPGSGDKSGAISGNHGHTAVITAAQLTAGNAVDVLLTEGTGHTHHLALSANQVAAVAANQSVSGTSSNDGGHSHTVTFN